MWLAVSRPMVEVRNFVCELLCTYASYSPFAKSRAGGVSPQFTYLGSQLIAAMAMAMPLHRHDNSPTNLHPRCWDSFGNSFESPLIMSPMTNPDGIEFLKSPTP